MELLFLGTGADTAVPLPFCRCEICRAARIQRGKDFRRRSSLLVNRDLLIDLGPDVLTAAAQFGADISAVRYLLETHAHADHFDPNHLLTRLPDYGVENPSPLTLLASAGSLGRMSEDMDRERAGASLIDPKWLERLCVQVLTANHGIPTELGPYRVLPIRTGHAPAVESMIYAITDSQITLLYATDTTDFDALMWDAAASFGPFHCVILDHTYGSGIRGDGHLNADQVATLTTQFRERKLLAPGGAVWATHISHEGMPLHRELCQQAKRAGYQVAYDGLRVTLE